MLAILILVWNTLSSLHKRATQHASADASWHMAGPCQYQHSFTTRGVRVEWLRHALGCVCALHFVEKS